MKALLLTVAILVTALAPAAAAEKDLDQAKAYFDAGKQAYEAREYLAAALAFEQAYDFSKNAAVLFSTAQAYRLHFLLERDVTSLDRAIDLYRRYLVEVRGGSRRTDAAEHLASLELQLAQLSPESRSGQTAGPRRTQIMVASRTEGARASVDDGDAAEVPVVRAADPGPHRVKVTKEGYFTETLRVEAVEGRLVVAQVDLRPMPARLNVAAPAGAKIAVDGRPLGEAPLGSVDLEAGSRLVTVQARGKHGFAKEVALKRGAESYVAVQLEDTGQRTISYIVLGAAGITLTAAITTGTMALLNEASARVYLTRKDVLKEDLTAADLEQYRSARARKGTFTKTFVSTLITSAVLTAVGGALYYLDEPGSNTPTLVVAPMVDGAGTVGVGSVVRF